MGQRQGMAAPSGPPPPAPRSTSIQPQPNPGVEPSPPPPPPPPPPPTPAQYALPALRIRPDSPRLAARLHLMQGPSHACHLGGFFLGGGQAGQLRVLHGAVGGGACTLGLWRGDRGRHHHGEGPGGWVGGLGGPVARRAGCCHHHVGYPSCGSYGSCGPRRSDVWGLVACGTSAAANAVRSHAAAP